MRLLDLFRREKRSRETVKASDPYLEEFFGKGPLGEAAGLAVAHRAIQLISESLASVPLKLYRRTANGGKEPATEIPLYDVLQRQFSDQLTSFEGREWLTAGILSNGNGVAVIQRDIAGQVTALSPIQWPVTVERLPNGRLRYKGSLPGGQNQTSLQEEILHIRYRTNDGLLGISPITHARNTFDEALSLSREARDNANGGFRPPGILSFDGSLGAEARERIRTQFQDLGRTKKTAVFDMKASYAPIATNAVDAEFIASRKLSNLDIARIFGCPPSTLGILDDATYSNITEESRALVVRCLAPWAKRIEQAMNKSLLTPTQQRRLFIEHELDGLTRGDIKTRYEAYRVAREWGWLNANEIRGLENLSEIEGGDKFLSPLNMTTLSQIMDASDDEPRPNETGIAGVPPNDAD